MAVMVVEALTAPTLGDARRAGEQLVKAGAARVLLFGSVVHGEARLGSDIDLVAIFDDIDYRERLAIQLNLQAAAAKAVDRRVDVLVTDWPEWRRRTEEVTASFEAAVAGDAVVLFDREPGEISWDKEIGLPDDNKKEALGKLQEASNALTDVLANTLMKESERTEFDIGSVEGELERHLRLVSVCRHSAEAIETAVKCLIALADGPVVRLRGRDGHRIDLLVDNAGEHSREAARVLDALRQPTVAGAEGQRYEDVSMWRQAGTYVAERSDEVTLEVSSYLAPLLADAAVNMTVLAASEAAAKHGDNPVVSKANRLIGLLRTALADRNLILGVPHREAGLD